MVCFMSDWERVVLQAEKPWLARMADVINNGLIIRPCLPRVAGSCLFYYLDQEKPTIKNYSPSSTLVSLSILLIGMTLDPARPT